MKKMISLLLTLALLCCASLSLAEAPMTGEEADEATLAFLERAYQDGCATLLMTGNPTTGYDWAYVVLDEEVASVTMEFLADNGDGETVGEGGLYSFLIKGLKAGETVIAFEYAQSWDEDSTVVSLSYFVSVAEDLTVTITGGTVGV